MDSPTAPQTPFPALTAMSFNLLYAAGSEPASRDEPGTWPQRRPVVRKIIERHAPDVIGFQEVQEQQVVDLTDMLGDDYYVVPGPANGEDRAPLWTHTTVPPLLALALFGVTQRSAGWRVASGFSVFLALLGIIFNRELHKAKGRALKEGGHCVIAVRKERWKIVGEDTFWISNTPDEPNSVLSGTWLPRICHTVTIEERSNGQKLQIFNTHLDWWLLAQARGGRILGEQINQRWNGTPQLLMGDFNAPRHSATWKALMEAATENDYPELEDALRFARDVEGPLDTFHGGDGEPQYPHRVDHILTRPAATAEKLISETYHEGEIYPSDHFPLVAKFGEA